MPLMFTYGINRFSHDEAHIITTADSRRAVVSCWHKYVYLVLINRYKGDLSIEQEQI